MNNILSQLVRWDKELFILLNNLHLEALDPLMVAFSSYFSFVIAAGIIIFFMIKRKHTTGVVASIFFLATIAANSLVNNILKALIARPRPLHEEGFRDIIHALGEHETSFSFYSGHSTSAFCIAIFSILYFRNKVYAATILLWAAVVAYSRIYLGRHYPLDIVCGMLAGSLAGYLGFKLYQYFKEKKLSLRA